MVVLLHYITSIFAGLTCGLILIDVDHLSPRLFLHSIYVVMFFLFFGISLYIFTFGRLIL